MTEKERAFVESLYREMEHKLKMYAKRAFRDEGLAEEAVQDTFRDVCQKVRSVMASPNPRGWVMNAMVVTVKRISTQIARDRTLLSRAIDKFSTLDESYISDSADPDILYEDLRTNQDYILYKRYVEEGITIAELAKEMGISADTCSKRLQRARKRLRQYFENIID